MSKKQKIIMLGAPSSGFNGVVTGSVVITPTPMSSQTIDITKSFNELDISGPTTLLYSGTPGVDGLRTIVGLQNTTASPVVVTLPGSPQAWSIDHGSVQGSFTIPAYGRVEMLFRWDDTDGIWVVSSMPMTIAQVKAILAILFSDIGGIIGPNQLGSGSALQVVRRNAANDALEFADGGTGSGDVTAAASIADNAIVRGDGGSKGVQGSGATVTDAGDIQVNGDSIPGSLGFADAHATAPVSTILTAPASYTGSDRILILPLAAPTAGQVFAAGTIAGSTIQTEWVTPPGSTTAGRVLLTAADAAAQRTALSLDTTWNDAGTHGPFQGVWSQPIPGVLRYTAPLNAYWPYSGGQPGSLTEPASMGAFEIVTDAVDVGASPADYGGGYAFKVMLKGGPLLLPDGRCAFAVGRSGNVMVSDYMVLAPDCRTWNNPGFGSAMVLVHSDLGSGDGEGSTRAAVMKLVSNSSAQDVLKFYLHTYGSAGTATPIGGNIGSVSVATEPTVALASITRSGTTATATSSSAHGYSSDQAVTIAGASDSLYNGTFKITVSSSTVFTYTMTGTPASSASGTLTASRKSVSLVFGDRGDSTVPALRASGKTVIARLADDSDDAQIGVLSLADALSRVRTIYFNTNASTANTGGKIAGAESFGYNGITTGSTSSSRCGVGVSDVAGVQFYQANSTNGAMDDRLAFQISFTAQPEEKSSNGIFRWGIGGKQYYDATEQPASPGAGFVVKDATVYGWYYDTSYHETASLGTVTIYRTEKFTLMRKSGAWFFGYGGAWVSAATAHQTWTYSQPFVTVYNNADSAATNWRFNSAVFADLQ